jgi:uncharacterized phage protein (TIGR01671 family)
MKREIKFRAWAKVEKKICTVELFRESGAFLTGIEPSADQVLPNGLIIRNDLNGRFLNKGEFELMQFTGLKDKNGKEIYEGDIVKTDYGKIGEVVFHINRVSYIIHDPDHFNEKLCDSPIEVIGNIYENESLLK